MGKLDPLWRSRAISPPLKARLIQTLVWPIVTYGAEAPRLGPRRRTYEATSRHSKCSVTGEAWKISYRDHVTNETLLDRVDQKRKLLPMVKSRKLKDFGHISCHTSLEKDMLRTMPGLRRQGGRRKEWWDDLVEWTGKTIPDLVRKAEDRLAFQRFVYEVAHARELGTAPWLIEG